VADDRYRENRSRTGKENPVEIVECDYADPGSDREGERVAKLEGWRKIKPTGLIADGFDNRLAGMAGVDTPVPGSAIENSAPVQRLAIYALRARQQARIGLEIEIAGKAHRDLRWRLQHDQRVLFSADFGALKSMAGAGAQSPGDHSHKSCATRAHMAQAACSAPKPMVWPRHKKGAAPEWSGPDF
jgi:hypothetical protein